MDILWLNHDFITTKASTGRCFQMDTPNRFSECQKVWFFCETFIGVMRKCSNFSFRKIWWDEKPYYTFRRGGLSGVFMVCGCIQLVLFTGEANWQGPHLCKLHSFADTCGGKATRAAVVMLLIHMFLSSLYRDPYLVVFFRSCNESFSATRAPFYLLPLSTQ